MDEVTKRREYAMVGIQRYWLISRDSAHTVTTYRLGAAGGYEELTKLPLAWLLQTSPADHLN
ncbi:MAG TPA: Uma2 family endonuclease [Micromonosporaceae bacterium]